MKITITFNVSCEIWGGYLRVRELSMECKSERAFDTLSSTVFYPAYGKHIAFSMRQDRGSSSLNKVTRWIEIVNRGNEKQTEYLAGDVSTHLVLKATLERNPIQYIQQNSFDLKGIQCN